MRKYIILLSVLVIILFIGYKIYRINEIKNDEYVYLDKSYVFHIDKKCDNIKGGVIYFNKNRVRMIKFACPDCISENDYKSLQDLIEKNTKDIID